MAHANFEEWLVNYLEKSCGFNPEDAVEIKDEIVKNIKWYADQNQTQDPKVPAIDWHKLAEELKRSHQKPTKPNSLSPPTYVPVAPWQQPYQPYTGDPPPGNFSPYTGDPLPDDRPTWKSNGKIYSNQYHKFDVRNQDDSK